MSEPAFPPHIRKALDAYTVPPVPQGFSDRLMTRITSGNTNTQGTLLQTPSPRSRPSSPWRRTSRIMGSLVIFSLATAAAAAAGIFGEPVYVPGVSEALVKARIVEAPKPVLPAKIRMVAETRASDLPEITPSMAGGSTAVLDRLAELRNDPQFSALPPRQRMAVAGREVRQMVRSGEATREEARNAVRTLVQNADPATREALHAAVIERRALREERLEGRAERLRADPQATSVLPPEGAVGAPINTLVPQLQADGAVAEKVEDLRERVRTATPEQRDALRAAIRERRQLRQQRRGQ